MASEMFRRLIALADAFQMEHALTDEQMAERAGLMRESYVRARKKGRTGEGDVETATAEKIARAIGKRWELIDVEPTLHPGAPASGAGLEAPAVHGLQPGEKGRRS